MALCATARYFEGVVVAWVERAGRAGRHLAESHRPSLTKGKAALAEPCPILPKPD
jgi:hypothetical protein